MEQYLDYSEEDAHDDVSANPNVVAMKALAANSIHFVGGGVMA